MTVYWSGRTKLTCLLFSGFLLLFATCKKDAETIGADFLGPRSGIGVESDDTSTLVIFSARHDSVPTRGLNYQMLGALHDPDFGITRTNIYTQLRLPVEPFLPGSAVVDSIVLQLKYATGYSVYGKPEATQTYKVYRLTEALSSSGDSLYYSNRSYMKDLTEIGSYTGPFRMNDLTDSVYYMLNGIIIGEAPQLRIRLSQSFVSSFVAAAPGFTSIEAFRAYLNGLAIETSGKPNVNDGAIAYMNLTHTQSALVVYYDGGKKRSVFPIGGDNIRTNTFAHEDEPASLQLQPYTQGVHKDRNFVQPAAGVKTRVMIPNLLNYVKDRRVAIVGAELVFTVDAQSEASGYGAPYRLLLLGADSMGRNDFLKDVFEDSTYYGGRYRKNANGEAEYRFNLIRQVQSVLNEYKASGRNTNYGMNLIVGTDFPVTAQRVILNTNRAAKKVKLNLSYTVIK